MPTTCRPARPLGRTNTADCLPPSAPDPTAVMGRRIGAYIIDVIILRTSYWFAAFSATVDTATIDNNPCPDPVSDSGNEQAQFCTIDDVVVIWDGEQAALFEFGDTAVAWGAVGIYIVLVFWVLEGTTGAPPASSCSGSAPSASRARSRASVEPSSATCSGSSTPSPTAASCPSWAASAPSPPRATAGSATWPPRPTWSAPRASAAVELPAPQPVLPPAPMPAGYPAQPPVPPAARPPVAWAPQPSFTPPAQPPATGEAVWDPARQAYLQWDPARQEWLQFDQATQRWQQYDAATGRWRAVEG